MLHHKVTFWYLFLIFFLYSNIINILVWHDNIFIFSNDYNKEKYKIILGK